MAAVIGTDTNNWLIGTSAADVIKGYGGDDTLKGGGGADHIDGGTGIDTALYADSTAGVRVDLMQGRGYYGTAEGDRLFSIENVYGSSYRDILVGHGGANSLSGLSGDDFLEGHGGNDILDGGDGQDDLRGGVGADVLIGGAGPDMANYTQSPGAVYVSLIDNVGLFSDAQGDTFSSIENLAGSTYDDTLIGDNGANTIFASSGADVLLGLGGADILDGHFGADTMIGGTGDDSYLVYDAADAIIESPAQGVDTVRAAVSYVLPSGADIEFLIAGSSGAINLTGNASGNEITGNFYDNIINGGDGRDYLTGSLGQDSFVFNTPLSEQYNVDVITDFNVADDTMHLDDAIFSSSLGLGYISAGEFVIGAAAQDANDRIIYDSGTGALYYDSDGNGGTAAVQFARLGAGLALTHLDFYVV